MNRIFLGFARLLALTVVPMVSARAGTLHGTVTDRTTGKPAADINVTLIQLQSGMQDVAHAKTDAQGQFTVENAGIGAQPMLVRAQFRGVNFHQPLPPGQSNIQVDVFEPTEDPKTIEVMNHIVIFQPNGASLTVGEEYSIRNQTNPPKAYYRADGNFEFAIPENARLQSAAAWGPSGMPTVQPPMDKKNHRQAIAFAFRPGENGVRYSYELPYADNRAVLKLPTVYPGAKLLVIAAPSVEVSGDGLEASGQEQGMSVYNHAVPLLDTAFAISVSGTAPPASASNEGSPSGTQAQDGGAAGASAANLESVPGRLDSLKWPLIIGFLGLFALGAVLLARRPVAATVTLPEHSDASPPGKKVKAGAATADLSVSSPLAEIDTAVGLNLEALKDQIFRLELRRQAGTISEAEYAQQRARAEKVLRDLVRG